MTPDLALLATGISFGSAAMWIWQYRSSDTRGGRVMAIVLVVVSLGLGGMASGFLLTPTGDVIWGAK